MRSALFLLFLSLFALSFGNQIPINNLGDVSSFSVEEQKVLGELMRETPESQRAVKFHKDLMAEFASDPDTNRNVPQLIAAYGYPVEEHIVTASDGYILKLHRIPNRRVASARVVFLQHGLLDSAATWLLLKEKSFAFQLSDAGFDVWIGNSRGNIYSTNHSSIPVNSEQYWNFNWDQMSQYDLEVTINYALSSSGRSNLTYVGHSQGCTIMFAKLSTNPAFASKINLFISLAPAPIIANMKLKLVQAMAHLPASTLTFLFGKQSFMTSVKDTVVTVLCNLVPSACGNVLCLLAGCNSTNSVDRMGVVMHHFPAGTSVQNMVHYTQSVKNKNFNRFDYGSSSANQKAYGQSSPPPYNLANFSFTSTIVYYGTQDALAGPQDVRSLISSIPKPIEVKELVFGHGDFIWSSLAPTYVYTPLIKAINKRVLF